MILICDYCGKAFERKTKKPGKHYCSRSCLGKANGERLIKTHYFVCDNCGTTFIGTFKHRKRNKHFFCCKQCSWDYKNKCEEVVCEFCGCTFPKKRSDIERSKHNFCSRKCNRSFLLLINPWHPNKVINGKVYYRQVAETVLGRELDSDEEVHHIDENHSNHAIDNLAVLSSSDHAKLHAARKERDAYGRFVKKK